MSLNLAVILRESARSHPQKPAVMIGGTSVTYAELDVLSDRFATGLLARGLRPGDAVGLQLPNVPQFVIAYFGILKAGCVVVPMNVLFKAGEVGYVLADAGARLLVTWAGAAEEAAKGAADAGITELFVLDTPGRPARRRRPALRAPAGGRPVRRPAAAPVRPRRHRRHRLHRRHDGPPQGRRAEPLPAAHERRHPRPAVRHPRRRRRPHRAAAVPRLRALQHPQPLRALRRDDVAGPAVRRRARCSRRSSATASR